MSKSDIYITTSIPYVNAAPHVGFALELVQADAYARHYRLLGRDVRFQCGTDDNSLKNVRSAEAAGLPVQEFVDANADKFKRLGDLLDISNEEFVRDIASKTPSPVAADFPPVNFSQTERPCPNRAANPDKHTDQATRSCGWRSLGTAKMDCVGSQRENSIWHRPPSMRR
jgi:hypothetical protein